MSEECGIRVGAYLYSFVGVQTPVVQASRGRIAITTWLIAAIEIDRPTYRLEDSSDEVKRFAYNCFNAWVKLVHGIEVNQEHLEPNGFSRFFAVEHNRTTADLGGHAFTIMLRRTIYDSQESMASHR